MNPIIQSGVACYTITTTNQSLYANCRYIANSSSLVNFTLPAAANVGQFIEIIGLGAGGWVINLSKGQSINWLDQTTTTILASAKHQNYSSVQLVCVIKNTTWNVVGNQGTLLLK